MVDQSEYVRYVFVFPKKNNTPGCRTWDKGNDMHGKNERN